MLPLRQSNKIIPSRSTRLLFFPIIFIHSGNCRTNDADYPTRWRLIKSTFSRALPQSERISTSRRKKGERGIWQRRYWEHLIKDEKDFERHVDYIHYNPVKHGYVQSPVDWPYSSIHRYIHKGIIPSDWAVNGNLEGCFGEI